MGRDNEKSSVNMVRVLENNNSGKSSASLQLRI